MPDADADAFAYAVLQVVPRVERDERMNAGVVLFCRARRFLEARVELDRARLAALDPEADADVVQRHLDALVLVAAGEPLAGPMARLPASERFGWLVAPSSTIVQPSAVHTGLCHDPSETLERLVATLVG